MELNLLSKYSLDFQPYDANRRSPYRPMTVRKAWVVLDKFSSGIKSPAPNGVQVPQKMFVEQLENSLERHTAIVQQETKMPVSRGIEVQIYHGDPSKAKTTNSGFMRIIDNCSNDKQFGIFRQLLSVSGGMDNVTADLTLEFGTANDKMKLDLKDKRIENQFVRCGSQPTKAAELTQWFNFTNSMTRSWTSSSQFSGTVTLKLHFNDEALILIRLNEPQNSPLRMLRKMLEDATSTGDAFLVTANGSSIPCHKAVLMAQSEVFKAMFTSGMKEQSTGTVELDDMSESGIKAFLAYLYCSDVTEPLKDCGIAFDLIKLADMYGFSSLHEAMKDLILNKEASWCTVSTAINLWSFARKKVAGEKGDAGGYKEIEQKAIETLKSKTQIELDNCPEFQDTQTCPQLAKELCVYLLLNK